MEDEIKKQEPIEQTSDMLKAKLTEKEIEDIAFNLWTGHYLKEEKEEEEPNQTR